MSETARVDAAGRLSELLVAAREESGLSRADASRLLRCSQQTLQRWEEGTSFPRPGARSHIAEYLGFASSDDLLDALGTPQIRHLHAVPAQRTEEGVGDPGPTKVSPSEANALLDATAQKTVETYLRTDEQPLGAAELNWALQRLREIAKGSE